MRRCGLELSFFVQQLTTHFLGRGLKKQKKNIFLVANILKTRIVGSLGKALKMWPSYMSKDSIFYWEKLHNHFWLEREHP